MPLTPQDVRAKLFTSVRLKHGYDEDEVDAFLDQVEGDLTYLYAEIDRLTKDLADASTRALSTSTRAPDPGPGEAADTGGLEPLVDDVPSWRAPATAPPGAGGPDTATAIPPTPVAESVAAPPDVPSEPTAAEVEPSSEPAAPVAVSASPVSTSLTANDGDASPTEEMLRRTLILAQRTADALISEARAEATELVVTAREKADQTERAATGEHAARQRKRQAEHDHLEGLVEQLRAFEHEYRSRLRAYLHLQLRDLESSSTAEPLPGDRSQVQHTAEGAQPAALEGADWLSGDDSGSGASPGDVRSSA